MAKKLQADEWLFASIVGLTLFGVVMVYSASAVVAGAHNGSQYFYAARQAMWTVIGFGLMLAMMQVNYERWRDGRVVYGVLLVSVVLLLAVFAFPAFNGANRWIRFGGFSLQPSELSKLALALFLARFLEKRAGEESSLWITFVPCVVVTGVLAMLVVVEPDLGTAMMLAVTCVVLLYTAGVPVWQLCIAVCPAIIGVVALLVFVPWRMRRMTVFLDPWADPQGAGYQIVQSIIAVGSGGIHGLGFAEGRQKMFFLPFAHSDFIFAVVAEELGLVGALVVIGAFALFLWRGVRASLNAPDLFGMLLGFGLVTMIVAQALFNISVVLAIVPTKGIPLPFISYGGSSLLLTLAASGVLLNISQHARGRSSSGRGSSEWSTKRASRELQQQGVATLRRASSWTMSRAEALRLKQSG